MSVRCTRPGSTPNLHGRNGGKLWWNDDFLSSWVEDSLVIRCRILMAGARSCFLTREVFLKGDFGEGGGRNGGGSRGYNFDG